MSEHPCIAAANRAFAKRDSNTRITQALDITNNRWSIVIATQKANPKRAGKPLLVCATYCPFCGEKLHASEVHHTQSAAKPSC